MGCTVLCYGGPRGNAGDRNRTKTTLLPLTHTDPGKSIVDVSRYGTVCEHRFTCFFFFLFLAVTQHLLGHRMGFSLSFRLTRSPVRQQSVAHHALVSSRSRRRRRIVPSLSLFPPIVHYICMATGPARTLRRTPIVTRASSAGRPPPSPSRLKKTPPSTR